jgi:hypothetical protein
VTLKVNNAKSFRQIKNQQLLDEYRKNLPMARTPKDPSLRPHFTHQVYEFSQVHPKKVRNLSQTLKS